MIPSQYPMAGWEAWCVPQALKLYRYNIPACFNNHTWYDAITTNVILALWNKEKDDILGARRRFVYQPTE